MNRSHLAGELAAKFSHLKQQYAEGAVTVILETMGNAFTMRQRIEIRGFGSFSIIHRRPRIGRNPRIDESVFILERLVAHFKPGKSWRKGLYDHADLACNELVKERFFFVQDGMVLSVGLRCGDLPARSCVEGVGCGAKLLCWANTSCFEKWPCD